MKRSSEIEQLMRDVAKALEQGDIAFVEDRTSRQPGTVVIGSAAEEYTRDHDRIFGLYREATPEAPMHVHVRMDEVRGYEQDDVGWADGIGTFERGGDSVEVRHTAVLRREDGRWRLVQTHASIGVPNERLFDPMFQGRHASTG